MKTVTITVNWDNLDSIKCAEKTKASLENKGYKLVNQFDGMFHSRLIYTPPSPVTTETSQGEWEYHFTVDPAVDTENK